MNIQQVSIIGMGIMGKGLAHDFAYHGYKVCLWGRRNTQDTQKELDAYLENEMKKKRLSDSYFMKLKEHIVVKCLQDARDLIHSQLIIETIVEDLEQKHKIFKYISEYTSPTAIITSNTSTLPVYELSREVERPERFLGTHFFSPVPYTKLVEVAKTKYTSERALETVLSIIKVLGKEAFVVGDTPGFIFNRIFLCTLNEAMCLLDSMPEATAEQVDKIIAHGWNMKYGPLQLVDLVGLDTIYSCLSNLYEYLKLDQYKPPRILMDHIAKGNFGKKSGQGFYQYQQAVND